MFYTYLMVVFIKSRAYYSIYDIDPAERITMFRISICHNSELKYNESFHIAFINKIINMI